MKIVKDVVVGGVGLSVGSVAIDKVGGVGGVPQAQQIAGQAQGALGLAAVGLPIRAAGGLMEQTEEMLGPKKNRSKRGKKSGYL